MWAYPKYGAVWRLYLVSFMFQSQILKGHGFIQMEKRYYKWNELWYGMVWYGYGFIQIEVIYFNISLFFFLIS